MLEASVGSQKRVLEGALIKLLGTKKADAELRRIRSSSFMCYFMGKMVGEIGILFLTSGNNEEC
jgi:hypothetical protein